MATHLSLYCRDTRISYWFGRFWAVLAIFLISVSSTQAATGYCLLCPFCSAPQLTLAEQIAQSDAAVIAEWQEGKAPDFNAGTPGSTTYRVERVLRSSNGLKITVDQKVTIGEYFPGEKNQFAVIAGTTQAAPTELPPGEFGVSVPEGDAPEKAPDSSEAKAVLRWLSPLEITEQGFDYVANAPGPENDPVARLQFFVKYLESPDPLVADDAYAEFANAPYETITKVADQIPREKVREWVFSEETSITRMGLYGLLLGLSGTEEDLALLEKKVSDNSEDFRLGIDGVMAGYLLLAKSEGLDLIEESKLKPSLQTPRTVPFSETFAALQAIKFMWEYAPGVIPADRLRASMRILLEHPDLADLIIIDLARWQDWGLLPQLKEMYGKEAYDIPAIKRAIVGFLIECGKQRPEDPDAEVPQYVVEAESFLKKLEEEDPKTVKTARLLFR